MKLHPIKHDLKTTLWCGPGALATITGLPTSYIMATLRHVTGRKTIKGVYPSELRKAGELLGFRFFEVDPGYRGPRRSLARWTDENSHLLKAGAVVFNVSHHYVTVSGRMFNDNWTKTPVSLKKAPRRRAKVRGAWHVVPVPGFVPAPLPVPPPALQPSGPNYRAKAQRLARAHGIDVTVGDPSPDCIGVWPPPALDHDGKDRHEGDHYVYDWAEALGRVEDYVKDLTNRLPYDIVTA